MIIQYNNKIRMIGKILKFVVLKYIIAPVLTVYWGKNCDGC